MSSDSYWQEDREGQPADPPTKEQWERWLEELRVELQQFPWNQEGLTTESLHFAEAFPHTEVVVIFRDSRRPECRFGYRWGPLWEEAWGNPASVIWANFDEARVLRLPDDCASDQITWLDEPIHDGPSGQ